VLEDGLLGVCLMLYEVKPPQQAAELVGLRQG
jgi:hypothetical protein